MKITPLTQEATSVRHRCRTLVASHIIYQIEPFHVRQLQCPKQTTSEQLIFRCLARATGGGVLTLEQGHRRGGGHLFPRV